jgi:hypothetical protein
MDKKSYNKLPEKNKNTTLNNFKKGLKSVLLQKSLYTVEEYIYRQHCSGCVYGELVK